MANSNKYECWGLSLSLKPPITNHDYHPIPTPTNKQIPNVEETKSATSKVVPKIIGMDIKPIVPLVIEEMEDIKATKKISPNKSLLSNYTSVKLPLYNSSFFGKNTWHDGNSGGGNGGSGGKGEKKKLRLCKDQIVVLEQAFREHMTLNTKQKVALARQVNLRPRQVEVWFQNRRARTKLKQTEIDCEYLQRFCQTLTEENKKLHKEVQQLRALTTSSGQTPTHHTNNTPTTFTMCPSCKTVSTTTQTPTTDSGTHTVEIFHR